MLFRDVKIKKKLFLTILKIYYFLKKFQIFQNPYTIDYSESQKKRIKN